MNAAERLEAERNPSLDQLRRERDTRDSDRRFYTALGAMVEGGLAEELMRAGMADVERLRTSLDAGAEWTRDRAYRSFRWNERRFRSAVAELRKEGYPVISVSEQGNVYRKAKTRSECEAFIERELVSRTRKLEEQIREMRAAADKYFGSDQIPLAI